jgi:hypothetical protein
LSDRSKPDLCPAGALGGVGSQDEPPEEKRETKEGSRADWNEAILRLANRDATTFIELWM